MGGGGGGGGGRRGGPSECLFATRVPQQPPCHGLHVLGVAARSGGGSEREAADQQEGGAGHGHGACGDGVGNVRDRSARWKGVSDGGEAGRSWRVPVYCHGDAE